MAVIETISLSGFAARDIVVPAGHRLTVKVGSFECPMHRLCDASVVKRNYMVDADETFSIASPRETRWRVGPVVSCATVTIETT
jgi:hypothetical protein